MNDEELTLVPMFGNMHTRKDGLVCIHIYPQHAAGEVTVAIDLDDSDSATTMEGIIDSLPQIVANMLNGPQVDGDLIDGTSR